MFDGFQLDRVDVGEVTLRVRYGGEGEPVVLLHGHPRTHTTWHRVAPQLAGLFFVVCPDLRGYGQSTLPPDAPGHAQSSKSAMAGDVVALMRHLGHDRFSVVGHGRGALVAFRTAMDHPGAPGRLAVMDGLPVIEHLERLHEAFVRTWWRWWFLGQTDKPAEAFISADPGRWYQTPSPAEMGEGTTPTCGPPSAIQPSSMACARTTAPACASTAPMRKPTGPQAARSGAQCCCSSRLATTSTSTATLRRSGGHGQPANCAAARSALGITRPNRRQTSSPWRFWSSLGVPLLITMRDFGQRRRRPAPRRSCDPMPDTISDWDWSAVAGHA